MRGAVLTACRAAFALALLATPLSAEVEPRQPYEMARSLQMLQDEVARGSASAHTVQRKLLDHMAERFLAAPREVWKERRNVRAALVHGLSGGNPKVLATLVERGDVPEELLSLARGALAYLEGRPGEAAKLLAKVDARALDASIAGHIALVQSTLVGDERSKKAIPYLNLARLLMPGTLVEEAALRRQCMIVAADGDLESFERLARQYLDRFGRSLYAKNFRQQFALTVVRLDYSSGPGRLGHLRAAIDRLEVGEQRDLYLLISRLAVSAGALGIARFASAEAARVSEPGTVEADRARLYAASVDIVGEDFEGAHDSLRGIDPARLDPSDARLLDSALALGAELRKEPGQKAVSDGLLRRRVSPRLKSEDFEAARTVRALIRDVDALLKQATP